MESFYARVQHRWPAGREDYHWHVLWPENVVSAHLVDPYRELTHERDQLAPVPARWIHMTVLHSGSTEQISDEEITRITDLVRQDCALVPGFDVTLDRPSIGRVAVECIARPGPLVRRLWQITAAATAAVIGDRVPVLPETYYPHLSLAYGTGDDDPAGRREMKAWLSDHLVPEPVLPVRRLSLVAQSHDGHDITWRHITDVPLADLTPRRAPTDSALQVGEPHATLHP